MATEYFNGTSDSDWMDLGDGQNVYDGGGGNDYINGADGQNTIIYELGDGTDSITFAAPRTYQFAGFLDAAMTALANDFGGTPGDYSNDYFATVDSSLFGLLPPDIASVLYDLQGRDSDGFWAPGAVDSASAQAAFEALVKIKGVGLWTANIYLLMALLRPDSWPSGDLALEVAWQRLKNLETRPNQEQMTAIAANWHPWRAVAARLLWHYYLSGFHAR